ncbi:hypothetical protein ACO0SA_004895 [Hanseniaspora valbyensis]
MSNDNIVTAPAYFKDNLIKSLSPLINEKVRVELKNNHVIYGNLQKVTDFTKMNINLYNVVLTTPKETTKLKNIAIRGNHIRTMIIPDLIDLNDLKRLGKPYSIKLDSNKKRSMIDYGDDYTTENGEKINLKRRKLK